MPFLTNSPLLLILAFLLPVLAKPQPLYTPTAIPPPGAPPYSECRDRCVPGGIISGTGCVSFQDFPFNGDWSVFGAPTWSCICFQARTGGFSEVTARGCGFNGCFYMLQDMYAEFNQNCTEAAERYNGTKPINSTTTKYPYPTTIQPTIGPSSGFPTYLYSNSSIVPISTGNITDSAGKVTVTKSTVYNSKPTIFTTTQGGSSLVETGVVIIQTSVPGGSGSKTTGSGGSQPSTASSSPPGVTTGGGVRIGGSNLLGFLATVFMGLVVV